jgi:hypothetical protein
VTADATVARQLALTKGQRVVRICRVHMTDGALFLAIGKKIITNNLKSSL